MTWRQFAPDVPEFLEIDVGAALGGLDPKRRIAARAAAAGLVVAAFHLVGQREKGFGAINRVVDHLLVQAMIRDNGETVAPERAAERFREAAEIEVVAGHRDRLDAR
jgi:dienelactone hydrolase